MNTSYEGSLRSGWHVFCVAVRGAGGEHAKDKENRLSVAQSERCAWSEVVDTFGSRVIVGGAPSD